jgi:hypothetical protein
MCGMSLCLGTNNKPAGFLLQVVAKMGFLFLYLHGAKMIGV